MKTVIRLLARLVERFPVMVVLTSLVLTGMFGWLATDVKVATGQDGFAPDSEEILAASRIGDLFGDEAVQSVMQIVIRIEDGDVITPEAYAVTQQVTRTLLESEFADLLVGDATQPAIVSYLAPVELGAAQAGVDPATLDAAAFRALYDRTLASDGRGARLRAPARPGDDGRRRPRGRPAARVPRDHQRLQPAGRPRARHRAAAA
jgi:hypothetical protein